MIILDTSGLLACIDQSQLRHTSAAMALKAERPPYLLSPFVLAELDYLLAKRVGPSAQRLLLKEVARGAFRLETFENHDIGLALSVMNQYEDLNIGMADASLVVLSQRHRLNKILTLDERHFRVLRAVDGRPFLLLPADGRR